jgi:hypothetical protein
MDVLLHVVQIGFVLMALGILASYPKFRQPELLAASLIYGVAAALSFSTDRWWPMFAGFGAAWLLLLLVGDRSQVGHRRFNLGQFLTRTEREYQRDQARTRAALDRATADPQISRVLHAHNRSVGDLDAIRSELAAFGLGQAAVVVIQRPELLEAYLILQAAPLPAGWSEEDRKLRLATVLRERLGG